MDNETSFGFFKSNIRQWLINECLESGQNPQFFWWALQDVFHDLEDEIDGNPDFFEEQIE